MLDGECRIELKGIKAVVLDGVTGAHDARMLKPRNGREECLLYVGRQARRHALHVDLIRMQPLGLKEELMPLLVRKTRNLRLDGGAVAWPRALDDTVRHGRAMEICADDGVCRLVRVGEVAGRLLRGHLRGQKGEGGRGGIALLHTGLCEVERAAVDARGCACLEPHEAQSECAQRIRECHCRTLSVRAAVVDGLAEDDAPAQICARCKDDGVRREAFARFAEDARNACLPLMLLGEELRDKQLPHIEVRRVLDVLLHDALIEEFVRLHAEGMDGGTLACVEEATLDARPVRRDPHLTAERVDLANEVALARAADGWVARHHGNVVERERNDERPPSHACRCKRRLDTRMPRTNHNDIIVCSGIHTMIPFVFMIRFVLSLCYSFTIKFTGTSPRSVSMRRQRTPAESNMRLEILVASVAAYLSER